MRFGCLAGALGAVLIAPAPARAGAGEKVLEELQKKSQLYPDERWQEYVQAIGDRLVAQSPHRNKRYRFFVVDNEQINAFTPGDEYVFISRGLVAFMGSEDQLAAVIGHEVGHVVARHMAKRRATEIAGKSLGFIANWMTMRPELRSDVSDPVMGLLLSGYGREMELEADRLGGEYLARAGYNPDAIIDAVWVLKDQQVFNKKVAGKAVPYHGVFASHPASDMRLHDAVKYARTLAAPEPAEPVGDFWALMDGLAFGDEAAGGVVRDGKFYHTGLRVVVSFPGDWTVVANRAEVRGQAPGGQAEGFVTVAHHAYVKRTSPKQYVTKVLKRDDVIAEQELEIGGLPAFIGELDTGESKVRLQLLAVLYRGKDVFLFKGECGESGDPERFREQFLAILQGLRGMTADDLRLANRRRVKVIVAEPHQTYARLAEASALSEHPEEMLRLLNADYPNGEPRAGDYVKVVK